MQALVTGACGFVGRHLCDYLLQHTDWHIAGTVYPGEFRPWSGEPRVTLHQVDLCDPQATHALVDEVVPDTVFHLAAMAAVGTSFAAPWQTLSNNLRGQLNLLEALRQRRPDARVLVIGSNEEYGPPHPDELPITEDNPLRPMNPYAVSKVGQDFMGLQYHLSYHMAVVRVRPFNHTGPRQGVHFVVPDFARQIARIEAGLQAPVLRTGNLDVARDFSDVRDVVRAYHLAVTLGEPGEVYNLASGRPRAIRAILETLLSFTTLDVRVERDPALYRPSDVPVSYGSAEKFRRLSGWQPAIPFEQTLRDTLDAWRERIAAESKNENIEEDVSCPRRH